jgi:5'-3' exonuclease
MSSLAPAYLVDASIYIFRYYFSMPDHWWSEEGCPTAAAYGYSCWLIQLLCRQRPEKIAVCFDESLDSCFRNALYPDYKKSRALPDEALAFQLQACRSITELLGVATYASNAYEADDLIGTLAARAHKQKRAVYILSRDKDLAQLLKAGDRLWDFPEGSRLGADCVTTKFGVPPRHMADYLALVGDPGDDIPGVPGIGPKTASALIQALGSIPEILANTKAIADLPVRGAGGLAAKLLDFMEQLMLMREVTRIRCDAPLGRRMRLTRVQPKHQQVVDFGRRLGFGKGFATQLHHLNETLRSGASLKRMTG